VTNSHFDDAATPAAKRRLAAQARRLAATQSIENRMLLLRIAATAEAEAEMLERARSGETVAVSVPPTTVDLPPSTFHDEKLLPPASRDPAP
jgi:hypothetical protein